MKKSESIAKEPLPADEIGRGSRRVCVRIPGTDLCMKRYRDDDAVGATVRREIARCRHDRRRNTCAQEYDYLQVLKTSLPADVLAVFPERGCRHRALRRLDAGGYRRQDAHLPRRDAARASASLRRVPQPHARV